MPGEYRSPRSWIVVADAGAAVAPLAHNWGQIVLAWLVHWEQTDRPPAAEGVAYIARQSINRAEFLAVIAGLRFVPDAFEVHQEWERRPVHGCDRLGPSSRPGGWGAARSDHASQCRHGHSRDGTPCGAHPPPRVFRPRAESREPPSARDRADARKWPTGARTSVVAAATTAAGFLMVLEVRTGVCTRCAFLACPARMNRHSKRNPSSHAGENGPGRDRTCDLGIKSPLLYQLSYRPSD